MSIWTTAGRLRGVRFACSAGTLKTLTLYRQGETDLVHRDGKWFLIATCDVPQTGQYEPGVIYRVQGAPRGGPVVYVDPAWT